MSSANRRDSTGARFKVSHSFSLKATTDFTKSALYKTDNVPAKEDRRKHY